MPEKRKTIIVGGFLGLIHAGGAVWDYIQYPLGLHLMGYDVYYLEDTMMFPVYGSEWNNSRPTIDRLGSVMTDFGLGDRWIYRDEVTQKVYGMSEKHYKDLCKRADMLINISCANVIREEYSKIPVRILLDSDPMFTQVQINSDQSFTKAQGNLKALADWHTHYFTFGENINRADCLIPGTPYSWKPTRQPVCLDRWDSAILLPPGAPYSTLMNRKAGKPLVYNGESWLQKDATFPIIGRIPALLEKECFKIAISQTGGQDTDKQENTMEDNHWQVVSPEEASGNHNLYQSFIYQSKGEISVAKQTYVKAKTGWFSGRSACYLASGRPVIAQDTGWSSNYPTGSGLFSFRDEQEAVEAIKEVSLNWKTHASAARDIANEYFDHKKVLMQLLNNV
jgi:hypothetical protein